MDGKRLIEKIRLRNILSFGDKGEEIELLPLNVIIGQNASGKSNLIDVIKLLRSLPQDKGLIKFISNSGGINEWIWQGKKNDEFVEVEVNADFDVNKFIAERIIYKIEIGEANQRLVILNEDIYKIAQENGESISILSSKWSGHFDDSFLSVLGGINYDPRDAVIYLSLKTKFNNLKIYDGIQTNRSSNMRNPQPSDALNDFLEEDGSNLTLILENLNYRGVKPKIIVYLQKFYPQITDYLTTTQSGTIQLHLRESGLGKPISAKRLSDGTLRYLCLLAILCHPEPPPLICIEEPETGLHPDILPTIAELMIEASQRTQLIVTTHSDILVSALSDVPEAVLVCEKDEDGTHFKRLNDEDLKVWMEEYSDLGEIWLRGGIGGTRW